MARWLGFDAPAAGVLAEVGSTGRSTGPHLHFETWRHGEPVDPARLVPEWEPPGGVIRP